MGRARRQAPLGTTKKRYTAHMYSLSSQVADGPASLELLTLAERLRTLAGEERAVQVAFLEHLDAFDARRGYAELGYPSLWGYCTRVLHLAEGAAARRIGAMRALRRHPSLRSALLEGRLSLSTLRALEPVLTEDNVADQLERASFRGLREVETLVAALRPESISSDGLRRSRTELTPSAPTLRALAKSMRCEAVPSRTPGDAPLFSLPTSSPAAGPERSPQVLPNPAELAPAATPPLSGEVPLSTPFTAPSGEPADLPSLRASSEPSRPPVTELARGPFAVAAPPGEERGSTTAGALRESAGTGANPRSALVAACDARRRGAGRPRGAHGPPLPPRAQG